MRVNSTAYVAVKERRAEEIGSLSEPEWTKEVRVCNAKISHYLHADRCQSTCSRQRERERRRERERGEVRRVNSREAYERLLDYCRCG